MNLNIYITPGREMKNYIVLLTTCGIRPTISIHKYAI